MTPDSKVPVANLLVVDDSPDNLRLLAGLFRDRGFQVRPVLSGERALQAARHEPPDLILLDINMPGMNGYEVCQRLKADATLQAIPVIFISALNGVIDKVQAFGVGGLDYVTKPIQFEEVEARVRTHLELARLDWELARHNAQLEQTVAARTRELAQANARLGVLDEAKSDFLKLIAHEIRTPLCGIFGTAELLLLLRSQDPATAECAKIYEDSRRRLLRLIDDALLLTRIGLGDEVGPASLGPLAELLAEARTVARPLAQSRGVHLAPVPPNLGWVQGAPQPLVRALQSLLETAVQFAAPDTLVRLTHTTGPAAVNLLIEADGQMVPPEALPLFFDLLSSSEPLAAVQALGFAPCLAERIVTLYGGAVSVANRVPPGIGLTVRLRTAEAQGNVGVTRR